MTKNTEDKTLSQSAIKGKTALITGASSGLGEQFAQCLSNAGARIILTARNIDKLNTLAKKLDNSKALQIDVTDKSSVLKVFNQLEVDHEKIDICINSAGLGATTPIFQEDTDIFENLIQNKCYRRLVYYKKSCKSYEESQNSWINY